MGLADAAASLSGHESGHLQNSAGQQVKQSFHLHTYTYTCSLTAMCAHMERRKRVLGGFHVFIMILTGVFVFE